MVVDVLDQLSGRQGGHERYAIDLVHFMTAFSLALELVILDVVWIRAELVDEEVHLLNHCCSGMRRAVFKGEEAATSIADRQRDESSIMFMFVLLLSAKLEHCFADVLVHLCPDSSKSLTGW